ncbi:MAG: hypothetical protein HYU28_09900 [Actinobacteria bacterium]|nr:hypothetical protein [Actinomycetota bacterium]
MALRDKLRDRAQPFLEPGEEARHVFLAQTGPSPYFLFLTYLIFFWTKFYVVAVTDRSVIVLRASFWMPAKPKSLHQRLPRQSRLGAPLKGLWGKADVGGERMFVHKRFHNDVAAADAELSAAEVAPPPPPPPPPAP